MISVTPQTQVVCKISFVAPVLGPIAGQGLKVTFVTSQQQHIDMENLSGFPKEINPKSNIVKPYTIWLWLTVRHGKIHHF